MKYKLARGSLIIDQGSWRLTLQDLYRELMKNGLDLCGNEKRAKAAHFLFYVHFRRLSTIKLQTIKSENQNHLKQGNITSWNIILLKMEISWERCCGEHTTFSWSRQCQSEQNIIRNEDNIGQYGNRLPVGEPCVCSALGGHAHSLQGGGNTGKQQDKLPALTPLGHGRIFSSMVFSHFL